MNVLIIGGAGYVGSHQTKLMCDLKYNVVILDNLNTGHLDAIDKRAKFYEGDVRDANILDTIFKENKIDGVIHFAALSLVGESSEIPLKYYSNNVYGMQVLLEKMNEYKVMRIVFSSSAAVYGEHEFMPIDETYQTNPSSCYGETKLAMEKMMKWVDQAHQIKSVALRYFNVAGASLDSTLGERHNPETHLIPLVLEVALKKREHIMVFGDDYDTKDGTCIRDYIHVEDLCNAHVLSLNYLKDATESEIFNLGYGEGFSVMQIIEAARNVTGEKIDVKLVERRVGDPAKLIASSDKIQKKLGLVYKYNDINLIIKSAYDFFKKDINE